MPGQDVGVRATIRLALCLVALGVVTGVGPSVGATGGCTIIGTEDDDVLRGTVRDDWICALGGNDVVRGLGDDDRIEGGDGDDVLYGDAGNDRVDGGRGADQLFGDAGNDTIEGGPGADLLNGGDGNDWLYAKGDSTKDSVLGGGGTEDRASIDTGLDDVSGVEIFI